MAAVTTNIQVNRQQAEALLTAVRSAKLIAFEFPRLVPGDEPLLLASLETIVEGALDRIGWLEQNQWHSDLRSRLAARTAYPEDAA